MKFLFSIVFLFFVGISTAQELRTVEQNFIAYSVFTNLSSQQLFNKVETNGYINEDKRIIDISIDSFCIDNSCEYINSPVYYHLSENYLSFYFRLKNSQLCLIKLIGEQIISIELFNIRTNEYIKYSKI